MQATPVVRTVVLTVIIIILMLSRFYKAKRMHPNIPFYLQDENGDTYEFKWDLIYQYISKLNS